MPLRKRQRRRTIQEEYNRKHGITPKTIQKDIREAIRATHAAEEQEEYKPSTQFKKMSKKEKDKLLNNMEKEMKEAAKALNFERAAELRDLIFELKAEG